MTHLILFELVSSNKIKVSQDSQVSQDRPKRA